MEIVRLGRRVGPKGSPSAMETEFGWVLCESIEAQHKFLTCTNVVTHHATVTTTDDILCKFWELEETPTSNAFLTLNERTVVLL